MTARLYVRRGGDPAALDTEMTAFTGRKGIPFFDGDDSLIQMGNRCDNGEISQGTFKLTDPDAELPRVDFTFNLPAHTLVTWTEDAPGAEIWLFRGRNQQFDGGRGLVAVDNQVEFDVVCDDSNIELDGQAFSVAWVRPAETDVARLLALQAYTLDGTSSTSPTARETCEVTVSTSHLTPNTNTVSMPAKTYPVGTQPKDVFEDCRDTAGKIGGVVIHHTGGSHLCLLHIVETNHATYSSAIRISDHLTEWDPEDPTAPVYEPHWEAGKATTHDGMGLLTGLVSVYGTDQSVLVQDIPDIDIYDRWTETYYDAVSVTPTQAAATANSLLAYRNLTHVTHRVSVIMLASQLDLIAAGMSLEIKAAAALGGQYLDTWQTRRVAECSFEPRYDGRYWAHLVLDRTPRSPRAGRAQPIATTPTRPPICTPDDPGTLIHQWSFTTDNEDDATSTYNVGFKRSASDGYIDPEFEGPTAGNYGYVTNSSGTGDTIPASAATGYVFGGRAFIKAGPSGCNVFVRFYNGASILSTHTVFNGIDHAANTIHAFAAGLTSPASTTGVKIWGSGVLRLAVDDITMSTAGSAVDNDPFCVPSLPSSGNPYIPPYDDPRFDAEDQHVTTRLTTRVINNSGTTLDAGAAVVNDTTLDNAVTTTSTAALTDRMVGVVIDGGEDGEEMTVRWQTVGAFDISLGAETTAPGEYLYTSSTPGEFDASPTRTAGAVGRVVTVDADDAPVVIEWWGVPDQTIAAVDYSEVGHYEVLMVDGLSAPPEPVTNEAEDDWLYGWVS